MGLDGVGMGFGLNAMMQGVLQNVVPQITPEGRMRLKREQLRNDMLDYEVGQMKARQGAQQDIAAKYNEMKNSPDYQPEIDNGQVDMDTGATVKAKNPNQKNLSVDLEAALPAIYRSRGLMKEAREFETANFNKSLKLAETGVSLGKVKNPVYRKAGMNMLGQSIKLIAGQIGIDPKQIDTYLGKAQDGSNEDASTNYIKGINTLLGAFKENKDPILLRQGFMELTSQFRTDIDENDAKMAENAVKESVANDQKKKLLDAKTNATRGNIELRNSLKGGGGGRGDSGVQNRANQRQYLAAAKGYNADRAALQKRYDKSVADNKPMSDAEWNAELKRIYKTWGPVFQSSGSSGFGGGERPPLSTFEK